MRWLAFLALAGCAPVVDAPGSAAWVQSVGGVVLASWPRAAERHIARACHPGPGPARGVLLDVGVDYLGIVRFVGPADPGDAGPFTARVAYDMLTTNCGRFPAPETPVRVLVRVYPSA